MKVTISALVNDTVGTLMAHAYEKPNTRIGVILGTGTNAAYVERVSSVQKWDEITKSSLGSEHVIINTEWGAYSGEHGKYLKLTKYDVALDQATNNKGLQHFEKMVSGMYLGELARLIIVDFVNRQCLFGGKSLKKEIMECTNSFDTRELSSIAR
jgi:hexokinase